MLSAGRRSRGIRIECNEDGSHNAKGCLSFGRIDRSPFKKNLEDQKGALRPDGEHLYNVVEPLILKKARSELDHVSAEDET